MQFIIIGKSFELIAYTSTRCITKPNVFLTIIFYYDLKKKIIYICAFSLMENKVLYFLGFAHLMRPIIDLFI